MRDHERPGTAVQRATGRTVGVIGLGLLACVLLSGWTPATTAATVRQDREFGVTSSDPPAGADLDARPGDVSVTFTEPVVPFDSTISVHAPDGTRIDAGAASYSGDGRTVIALVDPLGDARVQAGSFRVEWRAVRSGTGEAVTGSFTFTAAASAGAGGDRGSGPARIALAVAAGAGVVAAAATALLRVRGRGIPLAVPAALVIVALGTGLGAVVVDGDTATTAERVDVDWPVVAAGSGNTVSYRVDTDGAVELLFRDRRGEPRALDLVQIVALPDDPAVAGVEIEPTALAVHRYRIAAGAIPSGRATLDVLASGLGVMDSVQIPVTVP